jgi:hypothetical protein
MRFVLANDFGAVKSSIREETLCLAKYDGKYDGNIETVNELTNKSWP